MLLDELKLELEQLSARAASREFFVSSRPTETSVLLKGRELVDFANWDYLQLRDNKTVKRALQRSIATGSLGACSPRHVGGTDDLTLACELRLAKFLNTESALLFSSKNQVVLSLLAALGNERDIVFYDDNAVAPVVDATYLVNAVPQAVKINDISRLEDEFTRVKKFRRAFLFVESLSPVSGRFAPFLTLMPLCLKYGVNVIVDHSYALGGTGVNGASPLVESLASSPLALSALPFAHVCDLGLTIPGYGAALFGSRVLCSLISSRSKTFLFESPIPAAFVAAIEASVEEVEVAARERQHIALLSRRLDTGIRELGFTLLGDGSTPICCLAMGAFKKAQDLSQVLFTKGFLVDCIQSPAALSDAGVLRIVVRSTHTEDQVLTLLQALADVKRRVL